MATEKVKQIKQPMHDKKVSSYVTAKGKFFVVGLIFLIFFVIAAMYLMSVNTSTKEKGTNATEQIANNEEEDEGPVWKLYKNNKIGFSLLYPPEIQEPKESIQSDNASVEFDNSLIIQSGIYHNQNTNNAMTFNEFIENRMPSDKKIYNYSLGGKKGKLLIYKNGESLTENTIAIPCPNRIDPNNILTLTYKIFPGDTTDNIRQMLSTFRFLNN
jgi:hypothetical protein